MPTALNNPRNTAPEEKSAPHAARKSVPDTIAKIRDSYDQLRPAEQSVADVVLADVQMAVESSNAEIARLAGVSEPSVTRFCRAIGCKGVRDFKLQLVRSLAVGEQYLATSQSNTWHDLNDKDLVSFENTVLSGAHAALNEVERQLNPSIVLGAADAIVAASRVAVLGVGGSSSALAEEVQHRLFRYGVPIIAFKDYFLAGMTTATFRPGDVLIAISGNGTTREVIETVAQARTNHVKTIAITRPESELAKIADFPLTVQIAETMDTLTPSASRFAFLSIIDIVATTTGNKLGPTARENVRRIKHNVMAHREANGLEPLGG